MSKYKIDSMIANEWRELGFYYELDKHLRSWLIAGSTTGLLGFHALIQEYADNPKNNSTSEHEHFGPYSYLKIGTWPEAVITQDWIAGPLAKLMELSDIIAQRTLALDIGDKVSVGLEFSPSSEYDLVLILKPDDFDPARSDTDLTEYLDSTTS